MEHGCPIISYTLDGTLGYSPAIDLISLVLNVQMSNLVVAGRRMRGQYKVIKWDAFPVCVRVYSGIKFHLAAENVFLLPVCWHAASSKLFQKQFCYSAIAGKIFLVVAVVKAGVQLIQCSQPRGSFERTVSLRKHLL